MAKISTRHSLPDPPGGDSDENYLFFSSISDLDFSWPCELLGKNSRVFIFTRQLGVFVSARSLS